jgi:hypothetical protein
MLTFGSWVAIPAGSVIFSDPVSITLALAGAGDPTSARAPSLSLATDALQRGAG